MDRRETNPDWYRDESAASALADTKASIDYIQAIDPPSPPDTANGPDGESSKNLITPILTPRFAPSCTRTLLSSLGALAHETSLPIQTHISENLSEIALVRELFPSHDSYAHVYDAHNLLTPRTVLAHAVHLSASEKALIARRGAKVSHCPVSNTALSSGCCRVRELLDAGIEVGLGTDFSGGYSASVLVAAREAGGVARVLVGLGVVDERARLGVEECLYLGTVGGAKCLGLGGRVGRFEVGMEWDAQEVDLGAGVGESGGKEGEGVGVKEGEAGKEGMEGEGRKMGENVGQQGPVDLWGKESWEERVAKWFYCGDERNTRKVWVRGRLVHERV